MNKRRRELLAALTPAVEFALAQTQATYTPRALADVPGLAVHAAAGNTPAELYIYGPIGGGMFDSGIRDVDVAAALREVGPGPINVRVNSPGGDVFQGTAIHTLLARHAGPVTVYVDGLAASAASFIMLAGDRIVMAKNAMVMIHDGMTGSYGNEATLRRAADLLGKVSATMAEMYADRAGEDAEHWRALMTVNAEDGTWFTGAEAYSAGLVDELTEVPDEDEDTMVWDRLASWADRLPTAVAATVREHVTDDEQHVPDEQDGVTQQYEEKLAAHLAETDVSRETSDDDFTHAMRMWVWMQQNGHTARKEDAL